MKNLFENWRCHLTEGRESRYYTIDPQSPPSIEEIAKAWVDDGKKAYDPAGDESHHHASYTVNELLPYREYDWSKAYKRMDDKTWENLKDSIRAGYDMKQPIYIQIGRNGVIKIGEGNHRLAIARELGIESLPVFFGFLNNVYLHEQSFRYTPDPDDTLKDMIEDFERQEQERIFNAMAQKKKEPQTPEEEAELAKAVDTIMSLLGENKKCL